MFGTLGETGNVPRYRRATPSCTPLQRPRAARLGEWGNVHASSTAPRLNWISASSGVCDAAVLGQLRDVLQVLDRKVGAARLRHHIGRCEIRVRVRAVGRQTQRLFPCADRAFEVLCVSASTYALGTCTRQCCSTPMHSPALRCSSGTRQSPFRDHPSRAPAYRAPGDAATRLRRGP